MPKEKIEKIIEVENGTKYRIIVNKEYGGEFLQFRNFVEKKNFPDFWNVHIEETWRFIPEEHRREYYRLNAESCPISLKQISDLHMVGAYFYHSDLSLEKLINFTKKYPNIQQYFDYFNSHWSDYYEKLQLIHSR